MNLIKLYALTVAVFLALDFVWLTKIAAAFYQQHLGHLLRRDPLLLVAAAFYLLYVAGIVVFAVLPGLKDGSPMKATLLGGFLGLVGYATFDLTCLAIFKDFPIVVVVVDLVWGFCLTAVVAAAGFGIGRWLGVCTV